jgi:activator of HSP90 ATPase
MNTKTIKQTITFNAAPKEVYELIMDEKKHGAFTVGAAKISRKLKGKITVSDGYIMGYNIELEDGRKIVQAWHFDEDGWPAEHYSICTFVFTPKGGKTQLTFTQAGVPEHKAAALTRGWKDYYWQPMKAYLKNMAK